jgi:hypothetical protein
MKRSIVLASLLLAVPLLADQASLKDVHSVYVRGDDVRSQRDIKLALKHELPQVRVVSRESEADAVIDFTGRYGGQGGPDTQTVNVDMPVNQPGGAGGYMGSVGSTVTVPVGSGTYDPGHLVGVVHRGNDSLVIHEGLPSPSFATQFAVRFIAAWREANR